MIAKADHDDVIDISVQVDSRTPEWPGDTPFSCRWSWDMARGDSVNVSCMNTSPHVGTHADAPFHVDSTWATSEALALGAFGGAALVVDVSGRTGPLPLSSLGLPAGGTVERLLLRTSCTIADGQFPAAWPWLDERAIVDLVARGLRLLGVDAPSVDARDSTSLDTHRALFRGGAAIVENLDLRAVPAGPYRLVAYPLKLAGLDAAPLRAVLHRA
jgi:arylformamidase